MEHPKMLDDPERCVDDMLSGLVAAFPHLRLLPDTRVLALAPRLGGPEESVGLVSGGGAGHEPFCAGFVGEGMLAAAVSGSVFASPPSIHMHRALQQVARQHKRGVLLVIPNYTGDCLHFGLATEWARREGIQVESVVVGEDCALLDAGKASSIGRRGMCGLMFVFKIAGQIAKEGVPLKEVAGVAQKVIDNMATMGLVMRSCTLPGSEQPLLKLASGTVEIGMGIHGEAGVKTIEMTSASKLIVDILNPIKRTLQLKSGDKVAVLVNNLGGMSQLEQWIVCGIVQKQIQAWSVDVLRIYAGPLMTSLETVGVQVSILKIADDKWLKCLDASTSAPAWPGCPLSIPPSEKSADIISGIEKLAVKEFGPELEHSLAQTLLKALEVAAIDLINHTDKINELDSGCGDGDCGSTLARLAKGILEKLPSLSVNHPAILLSELANLAVAMGGTSGAIYGLLFSAASAQLSKVKCVKDTMQWLEHIAKSWEEGLSGIMRHSKARRGDRTMLDALIPACEAFGKSISDGASGVAAFEAAVMDAQNGCESTADMSARVGRASYVNESHLGNVDAGAYGVVVWLGALLRAFRSN